MKRWIYCFLCIIIIAVSYPPWLVMAGEDTHLVYEDLTIHLMPQYAEPEEWETDEPTVLVGIHGTLVNESEEPFSNEIRIPLPYEEPGFQFSQAGEMQQEEPIENVETTLEEASGEIVWQSDQVIEPGDYYHFLIEYYFIPEQKDISYKFSYLYELERDAKMLSMLLFEPFGAKNFMVSLDDGHVTNIQGIPAHVFDFGEVGAGTLIEATAAYDKEDNATTVEAMEALSAQSDDDHSQTTEDSAPGAAVEGSQSGGNTEGIVMIGLSIVIIVLFLFFGFRFRKKDSENTSKSASRKNARQTAAEHEIKALRKKLILGEIDEETYQKERAKHSS